MYTYSHEREYREWMGTHLVKIIAAQILIEKLAGVRLSQEYLAEDLTRRQIQKCMSVDEAMRDMMDSILKINDTEETP